MVVIEIIKNGRRKKPVYKRKTIITNFVTIKGPSPKTVLLAVEKVLSRRKNVKRAYMLLPDNGAARIADNTDGEYDYDEVFDLLKNEAAKAMPDAYAAICQFTTGKEPDANAEAARLTDGTGNDCTVTWRWHLKTTYSNAVKPYDNPFVLRQDEAGVITFSNGRVIKNEKRTGYEPNDSYPLHVFMEENMIEIFTPCPKCYKDVTMIPASELHSQGSCMSCLTDHPIIDAIEKLRKEKEGSGGDSR